MLSSAPLGFETPARYLERDHDQIDRILADANATFDDGEVERAAALSHELCERLGRHIRLEEEILFPDFERRTGMTRGPTMVMRAEHLRIGEALVALAEAADRGDRAGFRAACAQLQAVLPGHNMKEERVLYPSYDRLLSETEQREMTARLRSA